MAALGSTVPYYGGTQVPNPANVIYPGAVPSTHLKVVLGTIAIRNGVPYMAVAKTAGLTTWAVLAGGAGVTATGTTTATINGRSGVLTLTTPSIAGGATYTTTITNSSVVGSGTQIMYVVTGGTTGSALTVQSVTNTASQSVVVLQNGTGATTNTASLQLYFLFLN